MQATAYLPRRLAARLACRDARPGALVWHPAPPAAGDPLRARLLSRGILLFDGRLVETDAHVPWDLAAPDDVWSDHLHGHAWLDDAAAADDPRLWAYFEAWVWTWMALYADGSGPGWRADLVARRLTRWIGHAIRLLRGQPAERSDLFFRALSGHARYLAWRWREARGGARIEALGGLVYGSLALEGMNGVAEQAIRALGSEAERLVRRDGSIASRNPEELARILAILKWSARTVGQAGLQPAEAHLDAMRRAAPVVRALATPAGTLARFNGGRSGSDLPLRELTAAAPAELPPGRRIMGYLRLSGGPATLFIDAAPPPGGRHATAAHAGTLGLELWIGRQPVFVSAGSGQGFGPRAAEEGRRAAGHSTVALQIAAPAPRRRWLPMGRVTTTVRDDGRGTSALVESRIDARRLGLVFSRSLLLAADAGHLSGEDMAEARTPAMRRRFEARRLSARPLVTRFHLHPDIGARLALGGRAVALTLPDGARWLMHVEAEALALEPSRYHDETRARPRATLQIVAKAEPRAYRARIAWSLEPMERLGPTAIPGRQAAATPAE